MLDRRNFIISATAITGGVAVSALLPEIAKGAYVDREPWDRPLAKDAIELTPWVCVMADDSIVIRTNAPECGNGAMTQMALTVTEELQCDWSKVRLEHVSMNRDSREREIYSSVGGFIGTFAGRSTDPARMGLWLQVGASARERLKAAAAERWSAPVAEIEAKNSVLTHKPTGRTLGYGAVAARAAAVTLKSEPTPKPRSEWTVLGKLSPSKLSTPHIVNGSAVFGMDVRLPGMLYAALLQSPVHGGKLKSYNFDAIRKMPGVRGVAVVDPDEPRKTKPIDGDLPKTRSAIAIVADHYWQARKATEALPVEWDDGAGARWADTEQIYKAAYAHLDDEKATLRRQTGDPLKSLREAKKVIEATYLTPFCDQATMEPLNGTALVNENRVELWHPAAVTRRAVLVAADETGVPLENIHVNQTYVGGSFGRRLSGDDARMVVAVAKKFPGTPVHVIWSREESMRQGRYRPLLATRISATLDASGLPHAMHARMSTTGDDHFSGLLNNAYANGVVPNYRADSVGMPMHIHVGAYRAPAYNSTSFFFESFIDECAAVAGIDPLEYRLRMFARWPDPAWMKCLKEVAARSGWGKPLPRGQGQGIAISNWYDGKPNLGTTVAAVAHVDVSREGKLKVLQIDVAFDCGRVLNPNAVMAQLQGGTIFALNMSINEELNVASGRMVEGNYDTYRMLRMGDVPRNVNVHFGAVSGADRVSEVGEPAMGPIGPAVANAIYRATGKRIRTMPFRKHEKMTQTSVCSLPHRLPTAVGIGSLIRLGALHVSAETFS